jgi:hypothetical protein
MASLQHIDSSRAANDMSKPGRRTHDDLRSLSVIYLSSSKIYCMTIMTPRVKRSIVTSPYRVGTSSISRYVPIYRDMCLHE